TRYLLSVAWKSQVRMLWQGLPWRLPPGDLRSGTRRGLETRAEPQSSMALLNVISRTALAPPEAGNGRKDLLEAPQRADVAVAGGGLLEAEDRGRLLVAQLLEMPQREHFAVDGVHRVEGVLHPELHLDPDGGLAGCRQ